MSPHKGFPERYGDDTALLAEDMDGETESKDWHSSLQYALLKEDMWCERYEEGMKPTHHRGDAFRRGDRRPRTWWLRRKGVSWMEARMRVEREQAFLF